VYDRHRGRGKTSIPRGTQKADEQIQSATGCRTEADLYPVERIIKCDTLAISTCSSPAMKSSSCPDRGTATMTSNEESSSPPPPPGAASFFTRIPLAPASGALLEPLVATATSLPVPFLTRCEPKENRLRPPARPPGSRSGAAGPTRNWITGVGDRSMAGYAGCPGTRFFGWCIKLAAPREQQRRPCRSNLRLLLAGASVIGGCEYRSRGRPWAPGGQREYLHIQAANWRSAGHYRVSAVSGRFRARGGRPTVTAGQPGRGQPDIPAQHNRFAC